MNKPRSSFYTVISLMIIVCVIAASYILPHHKKVTPTRQASATPAPIDRFASSQQTPNSSSSAPNSTKSSPKLADLRKRFSEAHDYWDFAHSILSAATAGNPEAQFYLFKVLDYCTENNAHHFQRNGRNLTLDEALQLAASQGVRPDIVQSTFERCHEFLEQSSAELGDAADWLANATQAGQPTAEATTAEKILIQAQLKSYLREGAAATPENSAPDIGNGADPRDLMLAAVKSLDPEALFAIAWAQSFGEKSANDKSLNRAAWMYVACQRGFDCSANAEWVRSGCPSCDAQSPDVLMETISGDNWPAVQDRAREINAKLDAGLWNELGLGS